MAATMRAMVLEDFGAMFTPATRPVPEPGHGEVLVRVAACGAGLTLEHARNGMLGGSTPRILGHEFGGTVAAPGPGVEGWAEGDPVTGSFYLFCGWCRRCVSGRETLCDNNAGYFGVAVDGAFAEYLVAPARNLVRVPDGVSVREAGVVADAIATPYHVAAQRARIQPSQRVAVIGAGGGIGVHMLQMIRAFGAVAIAVERDQAKLTELEKRAAAEHLVDAALPSWPTMLAEAAEGRLDACVDMVCSPETLAGGVQALGKGGTFVVVGHRPGTPLKVDSARLLLEELVITGNRYATRAEIAASLDLVGQGRITPVIGATFPLADLNDAFTAIREAEGFGRYLIDCT